MNLKIKVMKENKKLVSIRMFCDDWKRFKKKHKNASNQIRVLIKNDLEK